MRVLWHCTNIAIAGPIITSCLRIMPHSGSRVVLEYILHRCKRRVRNIQVVGGGPSLHVYVSL